jgi:hypothetical protein
VQKLEDGGQDNIIAKLDPDHGTFARNTKLTVYLHGPACNLIPHWKCVFLNHPVEIDKYIQLNP